MVFAHQIRNVVAEYLSKDLDASGFLCKFSALSFNVRKDGEAEAIRLSDQIESCLVDLRAGCIKQLQFHAILRELIHASDVNVFYMPVCFPVSVNQYSGLEKAFPAYQASSDTSPAVEFGSTVFLPS
jgi:hypothetical protein